MGVVSVFMKKMQFLIYVFLKAWYAYRRTYFSELGYSFKSLLQKSSYSTFYSPKD